MATANSFVVSDSDANDDRTCEETIDDEADDPTRQREMVVAIDFGTTYSGIAYSFKHDYNSDPLKINCIKCYTRGDKGLVSLKMPTTLLLTPSEDFEAFGYEAEETYSGLVDQNAHYGWHYFKHFKMDLHKPKVKLSRKTKFKDDQGGEVLALKVFSESIRSLKRYLEDSMKNKTLKPEDVIIQWVLTVPAIWDVDARQFMREAAIEAGIPGKELKLALEPEAASIYCKEICVHRRTGEEGHAFLSSYDPGTKYLVADLGGGTADFTVREVMSDGKLQEVLCASGEAWGGMNVNKEFWKFVEKFLVGKDSMEEAFKDCKSEQLDFEREIEQQKRDLKQEDSKHGIRLHLGALNEHIDQEGAKKFQNTMRKGKAAVKKGKLNIPVSCIQEFFKPSIENIQKHFKDLFKKEELHGVRDVVLVGGFSECKIMQECVKTMLEGLTVVIPQDAGLAVLKGAVLYGHNPDIVSARISKFTYGTKTFRYFMKGFDDESKRDVKHKDYCRDVFNKLIEMDTLVQVGQTIQTEVFPLTANMTKMSIEVYKSDQKNPKYVSDRGCSYMGKMVVDMPDTTKGMDRKVIVSIHFGETELKCEGHDETTGNTVSVSLDLLS